MSYNPPSMQIRTIVVVIIVIKIDGQKRGDIDMATTMTKKPYVTQIDLGPRVCGAEEFDPLDLLIDTANSDVNHSVVIMCQMIDIEDQNDVALPAFGLRPGAVKLVRITAPLRVTLKTQLRQGLIVQDNA